MSDPGSSEDQRMSTSGEGAGVSDDFAAASGSMLEPSTWPAVIGWIGTVWGVLGTGCLGCGIVGAMMPAIMPQGMQQAYPDGYPPVMASPSVLMWVSWALSGVVGFLLIGAGIVLVLRKPVARLLHLVYAGLALATGAFGVWVSVQYQQEMTAWVNQNPGTKFAQQQQAQGGLNTAIMIVVVVLTFAWPAFCLIWFAGIKRDSAEIDRGLEAVV